MQLKKLILRRGLLCTLFFSTVYFISCQNTPPTMPVSVYKTLRVSTSNCTLEREFAATLRGEETVEIRPQVSGTISRVCVDEGQEVSKGEVLFVIDQVPYLAAVQMSQARAQSAKAALENAQMSLESKQKLHEQGIISDYDLALSKNGLTTAQAALATAEAELLSARNNLSYTEIKSPAKGAIGMISYRTGALVGPSTATPLTQVSDNSRMRAYFSVSESTLQSLLQPYGSTQEALKRMPEVALKLSNETRYPHKGRIDAISGNIDAATGAVILRASFDNPEGRLRNGGSGTVVLPYEIKDGIIIPQEATFELQDKIFVYKVVDGKAQSAEIRVLDQNDGKTYVVLEGIAVGDEIIAEGAGLVREGTPVGKPNPSSETPQQ